MATGGQIQTLGGLFADIELFEVPDFQRNYAWEPSNVEELHRDILEASKSDKPHFIGSTILMQKPDSGDKRQYLVVDGQQRMTTLFMYLSVLRDRVNALPNTTLPPQNGMGNPVDVQSKIQELLFSNEETGEQRFSSNSLNRKMFAEQIVRFPSKERKPLPARHFNYSLNLRKAYWRIEKLIGEELATLSEGIDPLRYLYDLFITVQRKLQILAIYTTNFDESFDIFMTLNSRGLALGPSDLVKSEIFKNITAGHPDSEVESLSAHLTSEWKRITDNLADLDIDQFLRHYLVSTGDGPITGKIVYSTIQSSLKSDSDVTVKAASENLLSSLIEQSALYTTVATATYVGDEKLNSHLRVMSNVQDSYRVFMMPVIDPSIRIEPSERRELGRLAELVVVRWVLTGGNAQQLEDKFQLASLELRSKTRSLSKVHETLLKDLPTDQKVKVEFHDTVNSATLVRVILHRINGVLGDESSLIAYDPKKIHVEHIAPASSTEHWISVLLPDFADGNLEAEYEALVEQWGNKTILDKHINHKVAQKPFTEKRDGWPEESWPGYVNSVLSTTSDLSAVPSWDRATIKARNRWIGETFCQIWAAQPRPEHVISFSEWLRTQTSI